MAEPHQGLLCSSAKVGTELSAPTVADFSLDRERLAVFNSVVWWFELLPRACLYTLTELKQGHERSSLPELRANSVEHSFYRANLPRALTLPAREMGKQSET